MNPNRICLVGAGNVSEIHAEALAAMPGTSAAAVCDPDAGRARSLAQRYGIPHVFDSVDAAIASATFDYAHVLVPPDRHLEVAKKLIEGRINVLVEKPMALSQHQSETLLRAADQNRVALGVNHNALFFPAYLDLRHQLESRALGPLQHLTVALNFPAQALAPAGHWMLRGAKNLIYESAIHPLSQIYDLAGPLLDVETTVSERRELEFGRHFYETWQLSLVCERATAQLFMSYAGSYRTWQLMAICQDGVLSAEVERNRLTAVDRTRWGRYLEPVHIARKVAMGEIGKGAKNLARETGSALRPVPRNDVYFVSMRDSIAAFHNRSPQHLMGADCAEGVQRRPNVDGKFGLQVVAMCDAATRRIPPGPAPSERPRGQRSGGRCDVAVLGGTGFIGTSLLAELLSAGLTVRVMARNTGSLPAPFQRPDVQISSGDIADGEAVARAIDGVRAVVHLAHGGRFSWEAVESSMVEPARRVAEACLKGGIERLVYTGTIASLYLGDPGAIVTGRTPTDPRVDERGPYEAGKARSEETLRVYAHEQSLPLCIMRPGVVLGEGGTPFHSGFGIWRSDIHCVGWNAGLNPLPLVLAGDVATAIRLALEHESAVGKCFNLVGDVGLSARECVQELRAVLQRPLVFHPMHPAQHQTLALSKWLARRALGRRTAVPSYRGVKSMGCAAAFDCADVKATLGWRPSAERTDLIERGLRVHRPSSRSSA